MVIKTGNTAATSITSGQTQSDDWKQPVNIETGEDAYNHILDKIKAAVKTIETPKTGWSKLNPLAIPKHFSEKEVLHLGYDAAYFAKNLSLKEAANFLDRLLNADHEIWGLKNEGWEFNKNMDVHDDYPNVMAALISAFNLFKERVNQQKLDQIDGLDHQFAATLFEAYTYAQFLDHGALPSYEKLSIPNYVLTATQQSIMQLAPTYTANAKDGNHDITTRHGTIFTGWEATNVIAKYWELNRGLKAGTGSQNAKFRADCATFLNEKLGKTGFLAPMNAKLNIDPSSETRFDALRAEFNRVKDPEANAGLSAVDGPIDPATFLQIAAFTHRDDFISLMYKLRGKGYKVANYHINPYKDPTSNHHRFFITNLTPAQKARLEQTIKEIGEDDDKSIADLPPKAELFKDLED